MTFLDSESGTLSSWLSYSSTAQLDATKHRCFAASPVNREGAADLVSAHHREETRGEHETAGGEMVFMADSTVTDMTGAFLRDRLHLQIIYFILTNFSNLCFIITNPSSIQICKNYVSMCIHCVFNLSVRWVDTLEKRLIIENVRCPRSILLVHAHRELYSHCSLWGRCPGRTWSPTDRLSGGFLVLCPFPLRVLSVLSLPVPFDRYLWLRSSTMQRVKCTTEGCEIILHGCLSGILVNPTHIALCCRRHRRTSSSSLRARRR